MNNPMDGRNCPGCGVAPGQPHKRGCDVERCSACGGQRLLDDCGGEHDPLFARWTGIWPGKAEADFLGVDLNELVDSGVDLILFKKPEVPT